MAEVIDKLALEYYLRRKVSHCNKIINGLCQEKGVKQSTVYNILLSRFCSGRTNSSDILEKIYYNIERNNPYPDMRPYAFFDLDTIYAYYTYLQQIIFYARYGKNDMNDAINLAMGDLLNPDIPLDQCGYYDVHNPVKLRTVDGKEAPLKRMRTEKFARTYEDLKCRNMLDEYVLEKKKGLEDSAVKSEREEKTTTVEEIKNIVENRRQQDSHKQEKSSEEKRLVIEYNGIQYEVLSREYIFQHRDNFTPLFQIDAMSIDGKYRLKANLDMYNKVYEGLILTNKSEKVCDVSRAEVISLQPTEEEIDDRRKKKGITRKPKVEGEFSMHELFDDF